MADHITESGCRATPQVRQSENVVLRQVIDATYAIKRSS